jgi:hypothetical protein
MVMICKHFNTLLNTFPTQTASAILPSYQHIPKNSAVAALLFTSLYFCGISIITFFCSIDGNNSDKNINLCLQQESFASQLTNYAMSILQ